MQKSPTTIVKKLDLVVWVWHPNDHLEFLKKNECTIAYHAGTIILGRDVARMKMRPKPSHAPDGVSALPVFRIENVHSNEAPKEIALITALEMIVDSQNKDHWSEVQIDFDARQTDRESYLRFLRNLRQQLRAKTKISITALSSWCLYDKWLKQAPVDETVAMFFSMGKGRGEALKALTSMSPNSGAICKQSLGLSINEPSSNQILKISGAMERAERIYIFSSTGWNKSKYEHIREILEKSKNKEAGVTNS